MKLPRIRVAFLFAGAWSGAGTAQPAVDRACAALVGRDGVVRAAAVAATAILPAHCRVEGRLKPVPGSTIGFELWLPRGSAWSGRYQMHGNGGYSSALPFPSMQASLARGSATIATDTGHSGDDPAFARDRPESIIDWGWRAVHLSAVAGKRIAARYYRRQVAHSYFAGCSTGGHQAMMEAQRFPRDFDGIVAGAPGSDRVRLNAAFLWQYLSNHRRGDDAAPILGAADLALLADHSLRSCGRAAAGPWLADPLTCRPQPEALACVAGQTTACLSPEKIAVARAMYAGAADPRTGARLTFPWLPGSERGWSAYWADPQNPREPARAGFWRHWAFGRDWTWWSFRIEQDLPRAMAKLSPVIDATDPDLSRFVRRGGKLIQYHGLADPVVSPLNTLAYSRAMLKATKVRQAERWYRLHLVPGMGHCGAMPNFTPDDLQSEIEALVETPAAGLHPHDGAATR